MCSDCNGLGFHKEIDLDLVIPDYNLSIDEGALAPFASSKEGTYYYEIFKNIAEYWKYSTDKALKNAPKEMINELLYGTGNRKLNFIFDSYFSGMKNYNSTFEGIVETLQRRYEQSQSTL